MVIRLVWLLTMAFCLAGCEGEPPEPQRTRPNWSGAEIEGIAPLMSPRQVETALKDGGYVQHPCGSRERLLENPLYEGDRSSCHRSHRRPYRIILSFLDLREGRRLVTADFFDARVALLGAKENLANSTAFAQSLHKRFGPPAETMKTLAFTSYYWERPGGNPEVRDTIKTIVGETSGANVSMQTRWAYDEPLAAQTPPVTASEAP